MRAGIIGDMKRLGCSYGLPWTLSGHSTEKVGNNNGIDERLGTMLCVKKKKKDVTGK